MHALRFPPFATALYAQRRNAASCQQQTATRGCAQLKFVSSKHEIVRRQRAREAHESNLIGSRIDDGAFRRCRLVESEIAEPRDPRHASELDQVMLALAEIMDGILGPDCLGCCVLENESVMAKGHIAAAGCFLLPTERDTVHS